MVDKLVTDDQEDMTLKLVIEASLIAAFGKLFRRIARDFRTVYSATGQVLDAEVYKPETVSILRPAYRRAGRTAGKELRDNIEITFPNDDKESVENGIDAALLGFANEESDERADIIGATTDKQLRNFTLSTIIAAALAGFSPSNTEVAKVAAERFVSGSIGRSKLIGIQEGLNSVEGARLIESNGLSQGNAEVKKNETETTPLSDALFREWVTRLDDHVRHSHQKAHGQRVFGTETPFTVGSSLLMYPGDTSLGASLEEIMGCRCFAATGIQG